MNSLRYAQKMIDLRLSYMQNNARETERDCNAMANLPIIPIDELLNKELTLSYYLDYLSVHNLQRYVIFYLSAKGKSPALVLVSQCEENTYSVNIHITIDCICCNSLFIIAQ